MQTISSATKAKYHRQSVANETERKTPDESVSIPGVFSEPLLRFCEAVVHPFGPEAIGATLPDQYQELVIPLTDRIELDLTPDLFNLQGDWQTTAGVQLTGIFMWFQPRCTAAGFAVLDDDGINQFPQLPYLGVDDTLSALNQSVIFDHYYLCFTGIWEQSASALNAPITYGFFNNNQVSGAIITSCYFAIRYTRFNNVALNCDKMRLMGAGIKMWSEQAPINTGGYCTTGWTTIEDICEALEWGALSLPLASPGPLNPGALKAFQPKIKFAVRSPGVKGGTARYSPLQTPEQVESEYPSVPARLYNTLTNSGSDPWPVFLLQKANVDLSIHDNITPGSYVPCIFWQFNTTDTESNNGVYTVKVMSMVHGEGTPSGESPFMACKSSVDPAAEHAKSMLENIEVFPVAASGHSFKSFLTKTKHVISKVAKTAGHITKILSLADKFAAQYM
jgi:hypothetical protein